MPTSVDAAGATSRAGKYLTFYLGSEEYGLAILTVSEIIGMQPVTRVPRLPPFVRGVINLRGKVLPVTDLRRKLGMTHEAEHDGCIVVVHAHGLLMGLVVDRVSEVVTLADADITDAPAFGSGIRTELLCGIATGGGHVRLLLDIDAVLAATDVSVATSACSGGNCL